MYNERDFNLETGGSDTPEAKLEAGGTYLHGGSAYVTLRSTNNRYYATYISYVRDYMQYVGPVHIVYISESSALCHASICLVNRV